MTEIPDRVPVLTQMHEFAMKELGVPAREFYTSPEILAAGTLEIQEKYGIDVPVLDYDVYNIEAEALGQEIKYSDTDMPDVDRSKPLIRGRDDLKKIRTPDFDRDGRFAHVIEMNRIFRNLIGGGKSPFGSVRRSAWRPISGGLSRSSWICTVIRILSKSCSIALLRKYWRPGLFG